MGDPTEVPTLHSGLDWVRWTSHLPSLSKGPATSAATRSRLPPLLLQYKDICVSGALENSQDQSTLAIAIDVQRLKTIRGRTLPRRPGAILVEKVPRSLQPIAFVLWGKHDTMLPLLRTMAVAVPMGSTGREPAAECPGSGIGGSSLAVPSLAGPFGIGDSRDYRRMASGVPSTPGCGKDWGSWGPARSGSRFQ